MFLCLFFHLFKSTDSNENDKEQNDPRANPHIFSLPQVFIDFFTFKELERFQLLAHSLMNSSAYV